MAGKSWEAGRSRNKSGVWFSILDGTQTGLGLAKQDRVDANQLPLTSEASSVPRISRGEVLLLIRSVEGHSVGATPRSHGCEERT